MRTNRLKERICQVYEFEEAVWNIPIEKFYGACIGILGGYLTTAQVVSYFALSAQEEQDWNDLIARFTAKSNTGNTNPRDRAVLWLKTILSWYEIGGIPTFGTPDEVWNWMMAI